MNQAVTNEFGPNRRRKLLLGSRGKFFALSFILLLLPFSFYGLRHLEWAVTFHPQPYRPGDYWQAPAGAEDVGLITRDGVRLHGWFIPSQGRSARATVIYLHGNSGNIGSLGWLGESLASREFDILLFDYRGFGRSEGEIRNEGDLYMDADAAYDYVLRDRGTSPDRIVLYGQSLGTAAATDIASREKCGALILESGMSSASDMAEVMVAWLPQWLGRAGINRLDSKQKLPLIHCPVLISHGDPDDVVPTSQGLALFSRANEPKKLILTPGAGHNVFGSAGDRYLDRIAAFIREAITPAQQQVTTSAPSPSLQ